MSLLRDDKYRDPVHGFIKVTKLENKIIDTPAFQRLRNIKQLAMTYLVFYGAEHTRFGHSLGVMHLVTKAFNAVLVNGNYEFSEQKKKWYEQILRLIALTHDLGHAPFSHAAEAVFPDGLEHEDFTRSIIIDTEIGEIINEIGKQFQSQYGEDYSITPEMICDIYAGKIPGENSEFTFLRSFMDSELDCDKMDYLLRDSLFCGVNYGKYDVERLISCLTIYNQNDTPRLAIKSGGIQAFEEFVLARYFMFVQVYFHRTRRYFDIMYAKALHNILPNGTFPKDTEEYLKWDDCKMIQLIEVNIEKFIECKNIISRHVYPCVLETKTHPQQGDKREFKLIRNELYKAFGQDNFIEDTSAGKMPHKIPTKTEVDDEKAIVIIRENMAICSTISEESNIIKNLSEKIDIERIYVDPSIAEKAKMFVQQKYQEI